MKLLREIPGALIFWFCSVDLGVECNAMKEVICPYCQRSAELVGGDAIYPSRPYLSRKKFWLCRPCNAYVGCHQSGDGTRPLGRLADAELRAAKQETHRAFDPLWDSPANQGTSKRKQAYAWLAEQLGISRKQCHIGKFDVETCMRAIEICREHGGEWERELR